MQNFKFVPPFYAEYGRFKEIRRKRAKCSRIHKNASIDLKFGTRVGIGCIYQCAKFQIDILKTEFFLFIQTEFCSPVPNARKLAMSVIVIGSSKLSPLRVAGIHTYNLRGQT